MDTKLAGAVRIENNTERNFKDLERMLGNTKALVRTTGNAKESLLAPRWPLVFLGAEFPSLFSSLLHESGRRLWVKFRGAMASR
jgi:hypothetical protein